MNSNIVKNLILEKILLRESLLRIPQNVIDDCLEFYKEAHAEFLKNSLTQTNPDLSKKFKYNLFDIITELNLIKKPRIFFPFLLKGVHNDMDKIKLGSKINKEIFEKLKSLLENEKFKEVLKLENEKIDSELEYFENLEQEFDYVNLLNDMFINKKLFENNKEIIEKEIKKEILELEINFSDTDLFSTAQSATKYYLETSLKFSKNYFFNKQDFYTTLIHELSHSFQEIATKIMYDEYTTIKQLKNLKFYEIDKKRKEISTELQKLTGIIEKAEKFSGVLDYKDYRTYWDDYFNDDNNWSDEVLNRSDSLQPHSESTSGDLEQFNKLKEKQFEEFLKKSALKGDVPNTIKTYSDFLDFYMKKFEYIKSRLNKIIIKRYDLRFRKDQITSKEYGGTSINVPRLVDIDRFNFQDLSEEELNNLKLLGYFRNKNINLKDFDVDVDEKNELNDQFLSMYPGDTLDDKKLEEFIKNLILSGLFLNLNENEVKDVFLEFLPRGKNSIKKSQIERLIIHLKNFLVDHGDVYKLRLFFYESGYFGDAAGHITSDIEYHQVRDTAIRMAIEQEFKNKNITNKDITELLRKILSGESFINKSFFNFNVKHRPEFKKHIIRNFNKIINDPKTQEIFNFKIIKENKKMKITLTELRNIIRKLINES
jgi:hypothetical protein